jgi:poly(hydroxyalkanoate) granule-associated protein
MADEKDRKFREDVRESAQKIWLAGLGALATAEEEGGRLFRTLVERGEQYESRGKERAEQMRASVDEATGTARETVGSAFGRVNESIEDAVQAVLARAGVPSREELSTLNKRLEELQRAIDALREQQGGP